MFVFGQWECIILMCMSMFMHTHVCVYVWGCICMRVDICVRANTCLQVFHYVVWDRVFIWTKRYQVGQQGSGICLSLPPQNWDCRCTNTPGLFSINSESPTKALMLMRHAFCSLSYLSSSELLFKIYSNGLSHSVIQRWNSKIENMLIFSGK